MIGIILIVYSRFPQRLVHSIQNDTGNKVRWYLFCHGPDHFLRLRLWAYSRTTNCHLFPYQGNRGIAKSWNDGLLMSAKDGNDITMLINDDVSFYSGAFDNFVDFLQKERVNTPDYALCTPRGFETSGPDAGKTNYQYLGCCAIGPAAIERVGYFDENFFPAYWEDNDYFRRIRLAELPYLYDERVLVEHDRSQTIPNSPKLRAQLEHPVAENHRYFLRKWGGDPQHELFTHPFDHREFDCFIPAERRHAPYGREFDRVIQP